MAFLVGNFLTFREWSVRFTFYIFIFQIYFLIDFLFYFLSYLNIIFSFIIFFNNYTSFNIFFIQRLDYYNKKNDLKNER